MRFGILEIVIILLFLLVVFIIVRQAKNNQNVKQANSTQPVDTSEGLRRDRQRKFNIAGLCLIALAIFLLFACISLFRWLLWGYALFFLALFVGIALLFLSRKA